MSKHLCPTCHEPLECLVCYRREISARGGKTMSDKKLAHLRRMTKARVKAQKERKKNEK
jgi:hypothetical protein